MAANSLALKHWHRIIQRWPVDKVRPEAVSFQTLMQRRLLRIEDPTKVAQDTRVKGNDANIQSVDLSWNEQRELKQVNALYTLLDNKLAKETPLHDRLRFPSSNPGHYDVIIAESERAPERSLWDKISNRLKGSIRLR